MTDIYWAALAGLLTGLLAGILAGGWCTYRALVGTLEKHGYDRGRFVDTDEALDMLGPRK